MNAEYELAATELVFDAPAPYGPVPVADPHASAAEVLRDMTQRRSKSAAVAVTRDGRLVGLARIDNMLAAWPSSTAAPPLRQSALAEAEWARDPARVPPRRPRSRAPRAS